MPARDKMWLRNIQTGEAGFWNSSMDSSMPEESCLWVFVPQENCDMPLFWRLQRWELGDMECVTDLQMLLELPWTRKRLQHTRGERKETPHPVASDVS